MNKKIIVFGISLISMILSANVELVHAKGVSLEDKYAKLLAYGIPEIYMEEFLNNEEIDDLYHTIFVLGNDVEVTCKTYVQEIYNDDTLLRGKIDPDILKFMATMSIQIERIEPPPSQHYRVVRVNAGALWKWDSGRPIIRNIDGVSINWDPKVFSAQEYKLQDGAGYYNENNVWITKYSNSSTQPAQALQGAVLDFIDLYKADVMYSPCGTMKVALKPNIPMYEWIGRDTHTAQFNINYVHDKNPAFIPGVNGIKFGISSNGLSFTFEDGAFKDNLAAFNSMDYRLD